MLIRLVLLLFAAAPIFASSIATAQCAPPPAGTAETWYGHLYGDNIGFNSSFWGASATHYDASDNLLAACNINTGYTNPSSTQSTLTFFEDIPLSFPLGLYSDITRPDGSLRVIGGQLADSSGFGNDFVLLDIAVREDGASFSAADLAGSWHFFSFFDQINTAPSGFPGVPLTVFLNGPGWTQTQTLINITQTSSSTGSVSAGTLIESDGSLSSVVGAPLSIASDGAFSFAGQPYEFRMDSSKSIAVRVTTGQEVWTGGPVGFAGTAVSGFPGIELLVKGGGTFTTSDLQGTWHGQTIWDSVGDNSPGYSVVSLEIDSSGTLTNGTIEETSSSTSTTGVMIYSSGSFSISPDGLISGSLTLGGVTETLSGYKMSADKQLIVGVDTDVLGDPSLSIFVPEPSMLTLLPIGTFALSCLAARRRNLAKPS